MVCIDGICRKTNSLCNLLSDVILRKNPTNAIYTCWYRRIHTVTLLHVAARKGPSTGGSDTFREQGQRNTCPDINIRLKSSVMYVVWQFSHCQLDFNALSVNGYGQDKTENSYSIWLEHVILRSNYNQLIFYVFLLNRTAIKRSKMT